MTLAVFILFAAGIQYFIGGASFIAPLRVHLHPILRTLVECTACAGFWIGVILGASDMGPFPPHVWGALGSGVVAMAGVPAVRYFGPDGAHTGGT